MKCHMCKVKGEEAPASLEQLAEEILQRNSGASEIRTKF